MAKVPTLESLAIDKYLADLEVFCAGIVQLARLNSRVIDKKALKCALNAMKGRMANHLHGTASTAIRQEMLKRIMAGRFPSERFQNQYELLSDSVDGFGGTEQDYSTVEEFRLSGKRCNSVCCTGVFLVECMLTIVVNEDLRHLVFDFSTADGRNPFWHKEKLLKKYVSMQIPAVVAHYAQQVREKRLTKVAKLERLVIRGTDIPTRQYALKNRHFEVLTTFAETLSYLEVPGVLSECADGRQYGAFCEHLMLTLGGLFALRSSFPRLTEIVLGRDACNTSLKLDGPGGKSVAADLFRGIGGACPNLRVLDVSGAINVSAECLLFLFFRDAYRTLHQYVYAVDAGQVHRHDLSRYCPWCIDEWCVDGVREGVDPTEHETPVVDDRLYAAVEEKFGESYLVNVVRASDLVRSPEAPFYSLERPKPRPWEPDFRPPSGVERPTTNHNHFWCEPKEINYTVANPGHGHLNELTQCLQCLKLNVDTLLPKHEIVPFLMSSLPRLRNLGHTNIMRALKMIRDVPALSGIGAPLLEEVDFGVGGAQGDRTNTNWVHDDISDFVEGFVESVLTEYKYLASEEKRNLLREDVKLLAQQCPRLKSIHVYLFGEDTYLDEADDAVWAPWRQLTSLASIHLLAHMWSESVALVRTVGSSLTTLYLSLDGRGTTHHEVIGGQRTFPNLEEVLELCPSLQHLTFSLGVKVLQVRAEAVRDQAVYPNLLSLTVHTYLTKTAFEYVWKRAPNLARLKASALTLNDQFPHNFSDVEFSTSDVSLLLKSNSMAELRYLDLTLRLRNIEAARMLVDGLPRIREISTLAIRVGLPQEDYANHEQMLLELARIMQEMRQFKLHCVEKKKSLGCSVSWKWERFGFLESFAEIEQLNALIDPHN